MPEFRIHFEWEEAPRSRAPELDATWARLEIYAGGETITRVDARRSSSVRAGIYVPLFPIAEWIVSNWFFMWDEWRDASPDRHNLLSAREGFALPDLTFRPTETKLELQWKRSAAPFSGLEFLSQGSVVVPKNRVRDECRRLVEAAVERLRRLPESPALSVNLIREWEAVKNILRNEEQRTFCERAARLGYDPFQLEDDVAEQIENLGSVLPEPLLDDFCDAIPPAQLISGASVVRGFIDAAQAIVPAEGKWREVRLRAAQVCTGVPWSDGYRRAGVLREFLGLNGDIPNDLDLLLAEGLGSFEARDFRAPIRIDAISAPGAGFVPVFGVPTEMREEKKRFVLARAVGDSLSMGQASLVTKGHSEHQQSNRAFAAEFLAPAEAIRSRISGTVVDDDDLDELAAEFRVSDLVIRHQIENHRLAELAV